jgi:hypothetical protein
MLDVELPAGAVPVIVPLVPTALDAGGVEGGAAAAVPAAPEVATAVGG